LSQHIGVPPPNRLVDRLGRVPVIGNPAFRIADYRRLWGGAALNHLGMSGEMVILGLLVRLPTGWTVGPCCAGSSSPSSPTS
jgi:hypothetical protein